MSAKGKIIQVQGDNLSLLGKIDTPPPEERTPPLVRFLTSSTCVGIDIGVKIVVLLRSAVLVQCTY